MQSLTLGVATAANLGDAMRSALRTITSTTGWEYGEGWLRSVPEGATGVGAHRITLEACWPRVGPRFEGLRAAAARVQTAPDQGLPARLWSSAGARWLANVRGVRQSRLARHEEAIRAGVNAVAAVPIFDDGSAAAMLLLFVCRTSPDDKELLALIWNAMAPLGHLVRHKLAEDKLAQHHQHLERLVEERTGQLERSRAQLLVSDRMAALGTLAAGLGHDMNNVLLPVRAHLNAVRHGEARAVPPQKRARHLDAIEKSVAYLQQLADGLHFLALDPERDDSAGDAAGTDLHQWWSQAGVLLSKAVPKHVSVTTSLPSGLPRIRVAAHRLTQAVLNLVVNAGEAIPDESSNGPGSVRIWAQDEPAPNGESLVRLAVADNGIGMPEEVRKRSLEMFYSTKVRRSGAGLGLAMVNRLAERVGGSLEIVSEVGRGTTVSLAIPSARLPGFAGDRSRCGPAAAVSVKDGRAAALVRQFLEISGARMVDLGGASRADIRVVEPQHASIAALRAWRRMRAEGRLVLFGRPSSDAERLWSQLDPIVIRDPSNVNEVRGALKSAAMSGSR